MHVYVVHLGFREVSSCDYRKNGKSFSRSVTRGERRSINRGRALLDDSRISSLFISSQISWFELIGK